MKMVAQQYGPQVRTEVITDAVQAGFADAMRTQNVRVAGYPRIEPKSDAAVPDQLQFSAVFEVYPDIRLGDLSTVTIERPVADVGPDDVRHTIDVLRKQRTRYQNGRSTGRTGRQSRSSTSRGESTASSSRAARPRTSRSSWARGGCCRSSRRPSPACAPASRRRSGSRSRRTITARKSRERRPISR